MSGEVVNDLIQYLANLIVKDPKGKIYIGTDSQNNSGNTVYATAIVFRYSFYRGAKVIFKRELTSRERDLGVRLTSEVTRTLELADWIRDNSELKIHAVELDLNSDPTHKSYPYLNGLKGWASGLGYNVIVKPEEQFACKAANELCR